MTDDLTPEEREALANLPRERTPSAGLEDRVVAALRGSGHFAKKPARVVRITTGRVAGLLAACVVLMIGAYSIGLNRGVSRSVQKTITPGEIRSSGEPAAGKDVGIKPPATEERALEKDEAASNAGNKGFIETEAPPLKFTLNTPQLAAPMEAKKEKASRDQVDRTMTESFSDRLAQGTGPSTPAAGAPARLDASGTVAERALARPRTFTLPEGTLIVDAPDSVRVLTDMQGRTLLIYTSDGVIRIRLGD